MMPLRYSSPRIVRSVFSAKGRARIVVGLCCGLFAGVLSAQEGEHQGLGVCGEWEADGTAGGVVKGVADFLLLQLAQQRGNLVVNTDRSFGSNGAETLNADDDWNEDVWTPERGAVFLTNFDRDAKLSDKDGRPLFDAITYLYGSDELYENWEIENAKDARGLTPVHIMPLDDLPAGAEVTLKLAEGNFDDFEAFHFYLVDRVNTDGDGNPEYLPVWGARGVEIPDSVTRWGDVQVTRWTNPNCPSYRETRVDQDGDGDVTDEPYEFVLEGTLLPGMKKFSEEEFDGVLEIELLFEFGDLDLKVDEVVIAHPWHRDALVAKSASQIPAFPGAEGYGAGARGGRGGNVVFVTTTDDYSPTNGETPIPGSLRFALEQEGPRTVVFELAEGAKSTIRLKEDLEIADPYVTLAGQTATGDGITLRRHGLRVKSDHVVVRYLRSRPGDEAGSLLVDALSVAEGNHIVIDHCSASWSTDEVVSITNAKNVTVQWCLIAEALNAQAHGYGTLLRGDNRRKSRYSLHHNLWAHHRRRMPRVGNTLTPEEDSEGGIFDIRANVFYNWGEFYAGHNFDTGGEESKGASRYNFVGNEYQPGPNSDSDTFFYETSERGVGYFEGNTLEGRNVDQDDHIVFEPVAREGRQYPAGSAFDAPEITIAGRGDILSQILYLEAGASIQRDAVDKRIVSERGRIINDQSEVGGWPTIRVDEKRKDTDRDGMPDAWELLVGSNIFDRKDGTIDPDGDGYTNLEDYLNSLAPVPVGQR